MLALSQPAAPQGPLTEGHRSRSIACDSGYSAGFPLTHLRPVRPTVTDYGCDEPAMDQSSSSRRVAATDRT